MLRYTLPTLRPCYDTAWNRYGIEAKGEPKDHLRRTKGGLKEDSYSLLLHPQEFIDVNFETFGNLH